MTPTTERVTSVVVRPAGAPGRDACDPAAPPARAGATAGGPREHEALAVLAGALTAEAGLTEAGARTAAGAIGAALATVDRVRAATGPAITAGTVPGPLVLTGLHRTGTTLLQRTLAAHPAIHAPRLWELMSPAEDGTEAGLVDRARRYVDEYHAAAPGFREIHPLDPEGPEECHRLIGPTLRSEIYAMRYRVPGYLAWLDRQDHRPGYCFHRAALRAVLRRRPPAAGTRSVLLKCPLHLRHLAALAEVYPGARVVRLHRDPVTALVSGCSLIAAIRGARAAAVDRAEIGSFWLDRTAATAALMCEPAPLPVLDVRYDDLVRDPAGVAAAVCDFAGVPVTAADQARMRRAATAGRRPGGHRYAPEDYGLRAGPLADRFADYRTRFAV